jgi:GDP/UDP-N,N'-diacetylbacillosamine 2-epimerase (hydrolysing)
MLGGTVCFMPLPEKILAISGCRSDYDLLSPLLALLEADESTQLRLLVNGAHLAKRTGYSIEAIKADGFSILLPIESVLDSDTPQSRLKQLAITLQNSIDTVAYYKPDLIIYAGDREEVMLGALLGGYLGIPTLHCYAGDHIGDGYIDDPVRHAASKLSTVMAVTLEQHKQRLVAMGESVDRIVVTGNLALDRFRTTPTLSVQPLAERLSVSASFLSRVALVIVHAIGQDDEETASMLAAIFESLKRQGIKAVVSYPNIDPGCFSLITVLQQAEQDTEWVKTYKNLDRETFINLYRQALFIIGNSSSGILEAASVPIPAIDIGSRQRQRVAPANVTRCEPTFDSIDKAVNLVTCDIFKQGLTQLVNPYGDGYSAQRAFDAIASLPFQTLLAKREDALRD